MRSSVRGHADPGQPRHRVRRGAARRIGRSSCPTATRPSSTSRCSIWWRSPESTRPVSDGCSRSSSMVEFAVPPAGDGEFSSPSSVKVSLEYRPVARSPRCTPVSVWGMSQWDPNLTIGTSETLTLPPLRSTTCDVVAFSRSGPASAGSAASISPGSMVGVDRRDDLGRTQIDRWRLLRRRPDSAEA